jgi:Mrp family chromosome partitioning ATPase/capsular polysaccharide biosynthesis protein
MAQSQIYIQPAQSKVIPQSNADNEPINSTAYDSFVQEQVQNATNPDVLINALHKLGPGAWQKSGESEQAAADRIGHSIEVARVATSYQVSITAKAKSGPIAAQIANAVAASVVEKAAGEGNAGDAQRIAVLTDERTRIQNELNSDYTEQSDLNKQLGMAAVGTSAPDLIDDEIGKTREELIKAQTDHDEAEARYTSLKAGQGDSSAAMNAEADDIIASDAGLTSMKTSLNTRRAMLISQMANLTPTNPEYKQDAAELAKINASLDSMMKDLRKNAATRIQEKLRTDLERTAGVEAQLNGQLRQLAETAASATPKLQRVNDLSTNIARLRNRYTVVDEQLHNLMLEDSAPGGVHLSVAAVAPLHPAVSGILKKALPLALGGLILGLLAASLANHLDPRVYIAADVEHVLGFAPMAVLPDFDEVSSEVASENLLRLSATIEHARKQGNLKSCIFTGTASGTGVTTVATRVRDILEAMGRPTVLLDASGTPAPTERAKVSGNGVGAALDHPAFVRGSRSTALLQQVAEEAGTQQGSLVLTDAAPLVISAETEYLARFVDCAIVVAESGVTTRAQLLAAVNALQRLDVATVGFVLNRVGMAKADPAFRNSIREIENHRRAQSRPAASGPASAAAEAALPEPEQLHSETNFRSAPALAAEAVSWPEQSVPAAPSQPAKPESSTPESPKPAPPPAPESPAHWPKHEIAEWPSAEQGIPHLVETAPAEDADMPWWLAEAKSHVHPSIPKPVEPTEAVLPAPAESAPVEHAPAKPELETEMRSATPWEEPPLRAGEFLLRATSSPAAPPVPAEVPQMQPDLHPKEAQSRLNGLRGLLFSLGLKNLSRIEDMPSDDEDSILTLEGERERTVLAHTFTPFADPEPEPASVPIPQFEPKFEPKAEVAFERRLIAEPEFLPPREFVPVKVSENGSQNGSSRLYLDDDIQILPSKRGQYKRRG